MARRTIAAVLPLAWLLASLGCSQGEPAREYRLRGQVTAIKADVKQIVIKHEAVEGYMDAMTMPFLVEDESLLADKVPGDLVEGILVVQGNRGYLKSLEKTGHAPLETRPPGGAQLLEPGAEIEDRLFVDQDGVERRLSDFRGRAVALTFIYTRCPTGTFCPAMDRNFAMVQRAAATDARVKDRIHLLSVTFDPEHDTPPVLKTHASLLRADPAVWSFLTGERDDIDRFASAFGLSVMRTPESPDEIPHNLRTAVIAPDGTLVRIYNGFDWTPDELLADLAQALG